MAAKRKLTMHCTPAMKRKLQALAKRSGCSMDFFIEAWFRMAIQCFDGKTTDLLKMLDWQNAKPAKERHSIPVTVRLAPEFYEGLQQLQSRTRAAVRARARRQRKVGTLPAMNLPAFGPIYVLRIKRLASECRERILGKGICNPKGSPECARNLLLLSSRESRRSKLGSVS
jgi:hypothetical protein